MATPLTYEQLKEDVSSEKSVLIWIEPFQRAVTWTLDSGAIYKRSAEFVIDVMLGTTSLVAASSASLGSGEWYYDAEAKTIYVRMSDDSNPKDSFVTLKLRYFFSDRPTIATHDLTDTGIEVEYDGLLTNVPSFTKEIDPATQLGIALESKGTLNLENSHGFFDPIFDKLFWNNKRVVIYSWFPKTPISEKRKLFEGLTEDKSFTPTQVSFKIIDQIFKLRSEIGLTTFQPTDGTISDDIIGTPKRRLYGEVKGVVPQSVSQILNGFSITGTISGVKDALIVQGVGTSFLSELSPEDSLTITLNAESITLEVDKIQSDTQFTVAFGIEKTFSGSSSINRPNRPYRKFNRKFHLADHKLREPTTTITEVIQANRLRVASTADLVAGNSVDINGTDRFIRRVSEDVIVLNQSLPNPLVGQTLLRNPINNMYFNQKELIIDRDYTLSNGAEATFTLEEDAEFNQAVGRSIINTNTTFTNGSRVVTGVGTEFTTEFKTRDWIVSGDITHQVYYEILQINSNTELEIRTSYTGATFTGAGAGKKNVVLVADDSKLIVDCLGKEDASGNWIKTASDVVKDLVLNDAELVDLDLDSFSEATENAPFIVALKLPLRPNDTPPTVREAINLVNKSVLGSLISKSDFSVAYNVLYPEKPETLIEFKDDDIVGDATFKSSTKIVRRVYGKYNHFDADVNTLEEGNTSLEFINSFVDNLIGTNDSLNVDIYLAEEQDAEAMVQRYALYHSLTQSLINIKTKLNLTLANLGDKIFISLDRMFYRYGALNARKKIGVITKLIKSGYDTDVTFTDLANIHDRVAVIADNGSVDFTTADESEKIKNGYIVDDSTELPELAPTSDDAWSTNIIG